MEPNRENYIPVLTAKGRPLAPCHPRRARKLVRAGKASFKHRRGIRCIILHKTNVPRVRNSSRLQLRIDPGADTTGIAVTREHQDGSRSALMGLELKHQGRAIRRRMTRRQQFRRNRRYRKARYRQPRFNNRTKSAGWLPPSIYSRLQNTLTWVRRLSRLMPITGVHVETTIFDPQLLRNPEIQGKEYQQGPLYRTNLRTAVLQRDGNKCVYCGKSGRNQTLELDHVVPRSGDGRNRHDNLVAACRQCNSRKGNQPLEQFLRRRPAKLAEIRATLGEELASAAHMNAILHRLLDDLRQQGWKVTEHTAATTAASREICGIQKSHHGDAAVTGCPHALRYLPSAPIAVTAKGRGTRQRIMPDRYGTPRGQGYQDYCKLPRHIQKRMRTPSHRKREKQVGNIATGDYVSFTHQGSTVHGYGTISHQQVAITKPNWRSTKADSAAVLERNHGYQISHPRSPSLATFQE